MKTLRKIFVFLLIPLLMGFSFEPDDREMTDYTPILMKKSDLLNSISQQPSRDFTQPGKIYLYENTIYMVDLYTGIHVIDNQDPTNPQKTGFIQMPGVIDMAIRSNVLFADNATDLVAIDLGSYPEIRVIERVPDIFPEHTPPDLEWIPSSYSVSNRPENTVIVAWVK